MPLSGQNVYFPVCPGLQRRGRELREFTANCARTGSKRKFVQEFESGTSSLRIRQPMIFTHKAKNEGNYWKIVG